MRELNNNLIYGLIHDMIENGISYENVKDLAEPNFVIKNLVDDTELKYCFASGPIKYFDHEKLVLIAFKLVYDPPPEFGLGKIFYMGACLEKTKDCDWEFESFDGGLYEDLERSLKEVYPT